MGLICTEKSEKKSVWQAPWHLGKGTGFGRRSLGKSSFLETMEFRQQQLQSLCDEKSGGGDGKWVQETGSPS